MYGYIFETTNTKTGDTYLGKRYAVSFDKNYFGECDDSALAVAIEKYGRPAFSVKMIMPAESPAQLDAMFEEMQKDRKPSKKSVKKEEVKEEKPEEVIEETVVEEPKPAKRKKSTKTED